MNFEEKVTGKRIVKGEELAGDHAPDAGLRPRLLDEYVGGTVEEESPGIYRGCPQA